MKTLEYKKGEKVQESFRIKLTVKRDIHLEGEI